MRKKKITNSHSGIYYRSNTNHWSLNNEFSTLADGSYVLRNVKIFKGLNEFKIADSKWTSNCNYGAVSNEPFMLYHNYVMSSNSNQNIRLIAHNEYVVDIFLKKSDNGMILRMHAVKF